MALDTDISLTNLDAVKSYIGDTPQINALWVYCDAGDATAATVEVTDTTMVLIITGGADAGTTTLTFANADSDTIVELVAKINAASGWAAGRLCHSSESSTDLLITGALSCLGASNQITLKIEANYLLTELINRASSFINWYCGRILKTKTYTNEVYYGTGINKLMLEQYPVTRIIRIGIGRANSFSILNTSTDMNYATVEITSSVMRLIVDGGTNADDTSLTLADYASIDLLIAAIHALAKGWSCTTLATDTASRDADELLIRPSMYVNSTVSAYCETADSYMTDYRIISPAENRNYGLIKAAGIFVDSTEYFVTYVAGFTTIPYALEQACIELVKYKYDMSQKDRAVQSEKIGQVYTYTLADLDRGLPQDLKEELALFQKKEF